MSKSNQPKLYEYRIKYNAGADHAFHDSYHYYNAENAEQALDFHFSMVEKHELQMQTLSLEKFNPYSEQWEDESEILETKELEENE